MGFMCTSNVDPDPKKESNWLSRTVNFKGSVFNLSKLFGFLTIQPRDTSKLQNLISTCRIF